jgi:hypothetical protein
MRLAAALFLVCVMEAQAPPANPGAADARKTEAEVPLLLHNDGKPMLIPFACTEEDMQWAGMTCSDEQPCPVYLELSALEALGDRLIVLGNIHNESTTLYSLVVLSEDRGATWKEPYERMRGVGIDHVQFIDFQNGWISGETLVPVSRDPFLLITSDGGKSWRLRPVVNDGIGGTIQQFHFESSTSGALVLDRMQSAESSRYQLYETPNGGETWMIRRTSERPLTIPHTAPDASGSDWRIHADARSKSFAIEKRSDERWSAAANFLVRIGACKPVPRPAPAPPPEAEPSAQPENLPSLQIAQPKP